jgi:heterodisulfide reductase subunit B
VQHLLDVLASEEILEVLRREVEAPLAGARIAPYYGCQFVRPGDGAAAMPTALERVIEATGATVADFPLKATCCGGSLVATQEGLSGQLSGDVLRSCRAAGATAVVTPCPLCQVTLEMAPAAGLPKAEALPILNLTQMVGLSLGLGRKALGLKRLLAPRRRLRQIAAAAAG